MDENAPIPKKGRLHIPFCGVVSPAGINRTWQRSNEEEWQSEYYNPASFLQTMASVYAYVRLPWAWRRGSWIEYLSFLAKSVLDHLSRRPLTADQVETLATAVLFLHRLTKGQHNALSHLWQDWQRLQRVHDMVAQAIAGSGFGTSGRTEILLHIASIRFLEDADKQLEQMHLLERIVERSIPEIEDRCQVAEVLREYALLSGGFSTFHHDARRALREAAQAAAPYLDARVRVWMAWPHVLLRRRY
ncbi:hypothetical protein [Candidatus Magnetaquicoccus inordinatus]|uniref:hypothetical protein n=1 Tax=Candidatus Magnetaquicoccus inordinatus TaxID=2496818 RepID=UPI00102ACDA7|nr:hypothetical protein [Candidatus Magnetaquicoccus inordinatus]